MNILITGVPGTGKSALARALARKLGYVYIDLNSVVREKRLWKGKEEGALVADVKALEREVRRRMRWRSCVVEGHLGCEMRLPVDIVVVLRTPPRILERRLRARRYSRKKRLTNLLCEALDYCTIRALENYDDVREIVTDTGLNDAMGKVERILRKKRAFRAGNISWGQELEKLAGRAAALS